MPLQATSGAATYDAFGVSAVSAVVQAEAIDFDGSNDYLLRSTALTGGVDATTFTFSAFVYEIATVSRRILSFADGRFWVSMTQTAIDMEGYDSSGTLRFSLSLSLPQTNNLNQFLNILVSVDLANTANRRVYINDVDRTSSTSFSPYANAALDFTGINNTVAAASDGSTKFQGRLSNVFFDTTYRDLTNVANRRLFITADLKPALGQAALNPILYLPMSDPTNPGLNTGTGGNFTLNGVVARSGRGPNQYNAPYSDLDGSADFLNRSGGISGIADSKQFTLHVAFNTDVLTDTNRILTIGNSGTNRFTVEIDSLGRIVVTAWNSTPSTILLARISGFVISRNYVLDMSVDLSSTGTRYVYVNGQASTVTWSTYTDDLIDFAPTGSPVCFVGSSSGGDRFWNGRLGALWFNTSYIDLSIPANLTKFVTGTGINAAPVDLGATGELPTSTSPLLYLPMYANNTGRNFGTGGDFTVNSGPYTGARGPNEFWGNWCGEENGDVGYLSRTGVAGINTGKTFSLRARIQTRVGVGGTRCILSQQSPNFFIEVNGSNGLVLTARNSAGTVILSATSANNAINPGTLYDLAINIDLSSTSNRRVSLDGGQNALSMTWTTYTDDIFGLNTSTLTRLFCRATDTTSLFYGKLGEFYFTTDYIDFNQEVNRLKFRDAFGNPVNLTQQIQAGAIPNPAIYMRFPPGSFGTNSGAGGEFTQSGNMYDGGQF
jgi:hypothetical protein